MDVDEESIGDNGDPVGDGMRRICKDKNFVLLFAYHGKTGGGRILLSPLSMINDGYFEVMYYNGPLGIYDAFKIFTAAKAGAEYIYTRETEIKRVKRLRITNKTS